MIIDIIVNMIAVAIRLAAVPVVTDVPARIIDNIARRQLRKKMISFMG